MRLDYKASAGEWRERSQRTDVVLQALKDMSPSEIDAWLTDHITTLAQARGLIGKMLYVLVQLIP